MKRATEQQNRNRNKNKSNNKIKRTNQQTTKETNTQMITKLARASATHRQPNDREKTRKSGLLRPIGLPRCAPTVDNHQITPQTLSCFALWAPVFKPWVGGGTNIGGTAATQQWSSSAPTVGSTLRSTELCNPQSDATFASKMGPKTFKTGARNQWT